MKYKVGDKVRIKSLDWYNKNKDITGDILYKSGPRFASYMKKYCGQTMTIRYVYSDAYKMEEDSSVYESGHFWTDEMIEGLVEKETCTGLNIYKDGYIHGGNVVGNEITLPEGYIFKDENGNVINATKIVLEKKHSEKLKLENTKKVREYWSEYARIYIEIYDDEPNECVLTHLYTLESHRQKGYGRQALSEAEEIAKELGCHTVYLKVETDSWMHQWYLRCGYGWYRNTTDDYTWLQKNL